MNGEAMLLLALLPVIVASAISDLRYLRIPNRHVLAAIGLFFLIAPLVLAWDQIPPRLLSATFAFGIAFILFIPGLIGGGDVKMMPAVMLFVPVEDIARFLQFFAVALGTVSLGALAFQSIPLFRRLGWESIISPRHVPVGLAMALSVIALISIKLPGH